MGERDDIVLRESAAEVPRNRETRELTSFLISWEGRLETAVLHFCDSVKEYFDMQVIYLFLLL